MPAGFWWGLQPYFRGYSCLYTLVVTGATSPSWPQNQLLMAESYAALSEYAAAAHFRRSASVVAPLFARISSMMAAYWAGAVEMTTYLWFLALDRSMLGPPMSMFSMHV